nr:uncharacterized protein DKFZp434B061-like [Aegilops tauschii subsp. strangulata]
MAGSRAGWLRRAASPCHDPAGRLRPSLLRQPRRRAGPPPPPPRAAPARPLRRAASPRHNPAGRLRPQPSPLTQTAGWAASASSTSSAGSATPPGRLPAPQPGRPAPPPAFSANPDGRLGRLCLLHEQRRLAHSAGPPPRATSQDRLRLLRRAASSHRLGRAHLLHLEPGRVRLPGAAPRPAGSGERRARPPAPRASAHRIPPPTSPASGRLLARPAGSPLPAGVRLRTRPPPRAGSACSPPRASGSSPQARSRPALHSTPAHASAGYVRAVSGRLGKVG